MANTVHHAATVKNDTRTAMPLSANPKLSGDSTIATLIANNSPPPKYPSEYPRADTKSRRFSSATLTSSES